MPDTYGDIWREVRLYCPFVPVPLAQHWVRDRYRRVLDRTFWGASVSESQFIIPAQYATGTASVTNGSATVTLGGGGLVSSDHVGRQFYVGGGSPYYTILSIDAGLNTLTLDKVYGNTDNAAIAFSIALVYLTPPSDFLSLISVRDPVLNWRLRIRISQDQLDRWDTRRTSSGGAWVLADYRFDAAGVPRFELWPRQTTQKFYPYIYYRRPTDLAADADVPVLPIRGDVLKWGALADLSLWPGTPEQRNPMFGPDVHQLYESRFADEVNKLMRVDQEIYLTDLWRLEDKWADIPMAPIDAKFLQSHDVN